MFHNRSMMTCIVSLLTISAALLHGQVKGSESDFPRPFDAGVRYIHTLHVDSSAGPGGDGSANAPFQAIADALREARPGTLVKIASGTYGPVGTVSNLRGEAQAPIGIIGNGDVVLTSNKQDVALRLVDPRFVVIQGITIRNTWPHGMNIDDGGSYDSPASHVIVRDVLFSGIGNGGNNDCLKMSGVDDFYIESSYFTGCNRGEAIDMVGCHNGVIARSIFAGMPGTAVQAKGGSSDILIHGNRFKEIGERAINAGGATGKAYFRPLHAEHEAARIRMVANVIEHTGSAPVVFAGCRSCVFANNTVFAPGDYVARIVEENPARAAGSDGYFVNNIVILKTAGRRNFVDVGPGTRPQTYTFGWNLWHSVDAPEFAGPRNQNGLPPERHAIVTRDPRLDAGGRLLSGSPALDAGWYVPGGIVGDFDRRKYGTPPSVGAFAQPE